MSRKPTSAAIKRAADRIRDDDLVAAAEATLRKSLDELDRTSYAMQAGAAMRVAAAAYALAVARGDVVEPPQLSSTSIEPRSRWYW